MVLFRSPVKLVSLQDWCKICLYSTGVVGENILQFRKVWQLRIIESNFLPERFIGLCCIGLHIDPARCIFLLYLRSAKGPSGPKYHIHTQSQPVGLVKGMDQHIHPFRGQMPEKTVLKAFNSKNRGDLNSANTCQSKFFKPLCDIFLINGVAHPPPAGPGFRGCIYFRPEPGLGFMSLILRFWTG